MNHQPPWHRRLRTARTRFVHRWHAAQTVGEWFGNESVGERFEHINHVRSLAQYVWRCGAFCEDAEGTGRIALPEAARSLRAIVKPVAAKGRDHFEMAVRYAARFGDRVPNAPAVGADARLSALFDRTKRTSRRQKGDPSKKPSKMPPHFWEKLKKKKAQEKLYATYAAKHQDIILFTMELVRLHRAMLRYYVQMRYLTPMEAEAFRHRRIPLLTPLRRTRRHPAELGDRPLYTDHLPDDLSGALLNTFARNFHHALACRARTELFQTLSVHPQGSEVASEARGRSGPDVTTEVLLHRRRARFVVPWTWSPDGKRWRARSSSGPWSTGTSPLAGFRPWRSQSSRFAPTGISSVMRSFPPTWQTGPRNGNTSTGRHPYRIAAWERC